MMKAAILLLGLPVSLIVRGLTLTLLWAWFVVPLGLPEISVPTAIGLSFVGAMIVGTKGGEELDTEADALGYVIGRGVVLPVLLLGIAWIVTWFM